MLVATQKRSVPVFVNDFRIKVREQSTVRDAVRVYDRAFLKAIEYNKAEVMDADGYPVPLDAPAIEWEHIYVCLLPWVNVPHRRSAGATSVTARTSADPVPQIAGPARP